MPNIVLDRNWVCNGGELKPKFNANVQNTWVIDGQRIKPKFNANMTNTYEINGQPALVIFGQLILKLW